MPAAFKLIKRTAASSQDATNQTVSVLCIDSHSTEVGSYPIPAPQIEGQVSRSFEIWTKLQCTVTAITECYNFKAWGPATQPDVDSSPPNKVTVNWGTSSSFSNPVSSASSVATTAQHSNYYSSGTALALLCMEGDNKVNAVGEEVGWHIEQWVVIYGAVTYIPPEQIRHISWSEA